MKAIDQWIFDEYRISAHGLALYRVIFASYALLVIVPRHGWLADVPDAFFYPPIGMTMFFSGVPGAWFFHLLNFAIMVAAFCLLLGKCVRPAWASVGVLLLVGNAWAYSFGKINHGILPIVVALVMSMADTAESKDSPREQVAAEMAGAGRAAWPMALLAMLVGMAMFTAAIPKLLTGWLDPSAPATLGHLLFNHFVTGRETLLSSTLVEIDSLLFWKISDYATLLLEGGFIVAMLWRRWFQVFCAAACLFHLGVFWMMDIPFTGNVLVYGAFVNWALILQWGPARRLAERGVVLSRRVALWHVLLIACVWFGGTLVVGQPWSAMVQMFVLHAAALIGIAYLVWEVDRLRRRYVASGRLISDSTDVRVEVDG